MPRGVFPRPPLSVRFWPNVDKNGPTQPHMDSPCWLWMGRRRLGYGVVKVDKRRTGAHRVAWSLVNGPIPEGLGILHHCDNPPCVNPDHLFPGTQRDNVADMNAKGRGITGDRNGTHTHPERVARGQAVHGAVLDEEKVRSLRREYATGDVTLQDLAEKYGVVFQTISDIVLRKRWRYVA